MTEQRDDPKGSHAMQLEMTDDAAALLARRGGILTVDLIRPTG